MKTADFQATIIHLPDPVVDLLKADIFTGTDGGNLDPVGGPADPAAGIDIASLETIGILKGSGLARHGSQGRGINGSRRLKVKRFMGALGVELQTEAVETALLGGQAAG